MWDSVPRRLARRDLDRRRGGVPQATWARCCPAPSTRRRAIPRACRFGCGGHVQRALRRVRRLRARQGGGRRRGDRRDGPLHRRRRSRRPTTTGSLRDACDRHGALLILDEVPICLGRTGTMFAFEHYGIVPDMVVLGKGLGGAVFPMAALIARRDLDVAADRALGHYTHEKSSVGCAAALATLDVIERRAAAASVARAGRARAGADARARGAPSAGRRRARHRPAARHRARRATARRRGARPSG